MTRKEQLKRIYKLHAWGWEELTLDQKMQEMNRITSRGRSRVLRYLAEYFGSPKGLLKAMKGYVESAGTDIIQLCRKYPWLPEEMLYETKVAEAKGLFGDLNSMYQYLRDCYGSGDEVLKTLSWVVRSQRGRAKTLCL